MKKYLIMTVGTGRNVEHGIARSIETANPDVICFITTRQSQAMPHKIEEAFTLLCQQDIADYEIRVLQKESERYFTVLELRQTFRLPRHFSVGNGCFNDGAFFASESGYNSAVIVQYFYPERSICSDDVGGNLELSALVDDDTGIYDPYIAC